MNSPALHPNADIDGLFRQACFEGAVLHLRNLVEFLEKARPTSPSFASDLVADHYFDDGWMARPDELLLYDASSKERNMTSEGTSTAIWPTSPPLGTPCETPAASFNGPRSNQP